MRAPRLRRRFAALADARATLFDVLGGLMGTTRRIVSSTREPMEMNQDPVLAMLEAAPVDDEPVTDDDRRHIAEGRRAYRHGEIVSAEEVRRACRDARGGTDQEAKNRAVV